jgi:hypothetical protein
LIQGTASTAIDVMRDAALQVKMAVSNVIQKHNEAAHVVGIAMTTESMAMAEHCRNLKIPPPVLEYFNSQINDRVTRMHRDELEKNHSCVGIDKVALDLNALQHSTIHTNVEPPKKVSLSIRDRIVFWSNLSSSQSKVEVVLLKSECCFIKIQTRIDAVLDNKIHSQSIHISKVAVLGGKGGLQYLFHCGF